MTKDNFIENYYLNGIAKYLSPTKIKKVLLVGHGMYVGYFQSLSAAFEHNHCTCRHFQHKLTSAKKIFETKGLRRIKNRLIIESINNKLLREVNIYQPDYIFLINGEILLEETLEKLNKKSNVILWLVDGVDNVNIVKSVLDKIQHVFVFEPADMNKIHGSKYLPQCADSVLYKKMDTKIKYDVSFVGAGHEKRLGILNEVALFCGEKGYTFGVFGQYKPFLKKSVKERKNYIHLEKSIGANRKLTPYEVNEIFNSTRINLNIHHEQSEFGLNPRVFEIMASENFQLIDNQSELYNYFKEGISMATYKNVDDLKMKIQYFLENEKERKMIARNGHELVLRNHLYRNRMETVLENIGSPKES
jgi:spore maturation protein CgeB